ncbi:hypothetical protein Btru_016766 [Bulinus truncatus]|nr:hypothetical protein Btru_016766 [Bulinus truncatus]
MSGNDLYSDMIDETLTNTLPAQVAALTEARKENAAELAKLQGVLSDLEFNIFIIQSGKEEKNRLAVEVSGLLSKVHALEEEGIRRQLHTVVLEKEITRAATLNEDLKCRLALKEEDCILTEKKCARYGEKLDHIKKNISLRENAEAIMKELKMIRRLTDNMVAKKESLEKCCSIVDKNESCNTSENNIFIMTSSDENKVLQDSKLKELQDCQCERKKLEMDNIILRKKNAALLIRLKNQLKEQQLRNSVKMTY